MRNPFDAIVAADQAPADPSTALAQATSDDQGVRMRMAFQAASDASPDAAQVAAKSGLPLDLVQRAYKPLQRQQAMEATPFDRIVTETPVLAQAMTNPTTVAAAKDDLHNLGFLEWLKTYPRLAWERGQASIELSQLRSKEVLGQDLTADEHQRVETLRQQLASGGRLSADGQWFRGALAGTAENLPFLWGSTLQALKYGAAGAATIGAGGAIAGSVLPGAGTVAGAAGGATAGGQAGFLYGEAKFGFETAAGQAYDEFSQIKDAVGRPLDPKVARVAALAVGAVNGALMTGGSRLLIQNIPGLDRLVGAAGRDAVATALRNPAVQSALLGAVKDYGKTLTLETANMVAQRAVQILGGELAKTTSNVTAGTTIAHQTPEQIGQDLAHTGVDALQSFALLTVPGAIGGYARLRAEAADAQHNVNFFQALADGVKRSTTVKRAPDVAHQFLANVAKDGPIPTLYAPIEDWTTYWQSKGVDPAQMAATVTGDASAYAQAVQTGGDLPIPTANYAMQLAGTEHNTHFADELRLAPEQMNAREAQQVDTELKAQLAQPIEAAPATPVRDAVRAQLEAAGYEPGTADSYAHLYEATFRTLGQRARVDPLDLFNRYALTVSREGIGATQEGQQQGGDLVQHPGTVAQPNESGPVPHARAERGDRAEAGGPVAADAPVIDTTAPPAQTEGGHDHAGTTGGSESAREAGRPAVRRVEASTPPGRAESATQQTARRDEHYADVFGAVLDAARAVDPSVDPQALRAEFDNRIQALDEIDREYRDGGHDPRTLLQAIASKGGLSVSAEEKGGLAGELRRIRESPENGPYGNFAGVRGVFRERAKDARGKAVTGLSLDDMVRALSQDPRFSHIETIHDLVAALEDVSRLGAERGVTYPGTRELAKLAGIHLDRAWWQPEQTDAMLESDAVDTGEGDTSFEFNQGPQPPNAGDRLDTGEVQPRLPGDVGTVREQEKPTPLFDAPFTLTPPENKGTKGRQDTLFQAARGKIRLGPGGAVDIHLLEHADLSTFIHESGHFFLTVMRDLRETSPQIAGDLDTLDQTLFAGAADDTERHERFARAFEAYLMEGKASSAELRPVFARVRAWLTGVYRSLRNLNVTLTPEVRHVFDRLVASDDAIAQAEQEGDVRPLFTTAEQAGMSDEAFATYRTTVADASEKAREALQTRVLRDLQREQQTWWTNERDQVRAQVATEYNDDPTYRAVAAIQRGTRPDGTALESGEPIKISKASLARYDSETLTSLRRFDAYRVEGGTDVDTAASLLGFSSGDELVHALTNAQPLKQALDVEADRRMRAEHGDLLLDGTLEQKAAELVNGDYRQTVVRAELKALAKGMVAGTIPSTSIINAHAETRIGSMRVRDIRPGYFLAAAKRASQRAFDLLAAHEDRVGAVQAKQQELVNLAYYREATKAADFAEDARSYLGPYFNRTTTRERIGKAGGDYLDQIDALRSQYEFARVSNKALDRRASLRAWLDGQEADGHDFDIPQAVIDRTQLTNYRDLTVDELRGVHDAVKQIEHWARFKNRLLRTAEKRELSELSAAGVETVAAHAANTAAPPTEPRLPSGALTRNVLSFVLAHRPLQAILRQLDGYQDGFFFQHVWTPAHEARNAETIMSQDAAARWAEIHDARFRGEEASLYEPTFIPAIGQSLTTAARLAVALNYGNDGNRERMRAAGVGNTGPLSDAQQRAILDTLDARDWQYVKDTAGLVNQFRPQIGALYKKVLGVEPTWVEPTPFQTAHGEMPGWYYPISYETRAAAKEIVGPDAGFASIIHNSAYAKFTTENGHTQERTAHTGVPLRADLGVVGEHLQNVVHDLTHREMLIDVGRLLKQPDLQAAIKRAHGDQTYREIQAAFRDIAVGPSFAPDWYKPIEHLRAGVTLARLAWSVPTIVSHVTNLASGMVRVGAADVLNAIPQWIGSAKAAENSSGWINEQSAFMAARWQHRIEGLDSAKTDIGLNRGPWAATLRDAAVSMGIDPDLTKTVADSYLYGIHKVIQMAEIPTWIAAYRQAVDANRAHADAVNSADAAILDAFGGGDLLDQARVQRNYAGKLFTTFMTYGLSLNRLNYEIFHKDTTIGRKIVDATLLNVVPPVLLAGIFSAAQGRGYGRELADELWQHATGMYVFLRELSGALEHQDYSGPSALAPLGQLTRIVAQTARSLETANATTRLHAVAGAAKTAGEVTGQFYGVPVYQIERTWKGLDDLWSGQSHDLSELLFGPKKKAS